MELRTKIVSGYLIIILIAVSIGVFFLYQLLNISTLINRDLPPVVEELSTTSYLNNLAQFIRYYDEVLTQSARNYAFTQDPKWKDRYYSVVDDLDKKIKEAIAKGDTEDKIFFQSVDQANLALVVLEEKSFVLVDTGKAQEAVAVLESDEYWQQKKIYSDGLIEYLNRRGQKYEESYQVSTDNLQNFLAEIKRVISTSVSIYILGIIIGVLVALVISWLISKLIIKPIFQLKKTIKEITGGALNNRVILNTKDELNDLANSFNQMANNLQDSLAKTEQKVKERTKNLEKMNKLMVGRELKMVELKKEIQGFKNDKNSLKD